MVSMTNIELVARQTVEALEEGGYRCCLFGSAACNLWGMHDRIPNDVDVVVFTNDDPEDIKEYLVNSNHRFYLIDGVEGDYRVLWYNVRRPGLQVKVDILIHGPEPLGIPYVPEGSMKDYFNDIPVMPFPLLLILKAQGWRDHRVSSKAKFRNKVPQDEADINVLLSMLVDDDHLRRFGWLPRWFTLNAYDIIDTYIQRFPRTKATWRSIGFDV